MEFQNFDAGLLVALDALLSEKSVTRAGERLHLSQPATSSILARLRRCFGNDLLVLTGRRMVLTPLAESLVQPVRDCLLQIQRTVASKTEFNPATSTRKFCLAVSEYTIGRSDVPGPAGYCSNGSRDYIRTRAFG